jgi:hypothetical protein
MEDGLPSFDWPGFENQNSDFPFVYYDPDEMVVDCACWRQGSRSDPPVTRYHGGKAIGHRKHKQEQVD